MKEAYSKAIFADAPCKHMTKRVVLGVLSLICVVACGVGLCACRMLAHEHVPTAAVKENVVEATCSADGSFDEVVYCSGCGEEISRTKKTIAQKEHTPGKAVKENVVEATCSTDGSFDEVVYCSGCGDEISREHKTIAKKNHNSAEKKENETPATCITEGSYDRVVYCADCGEEISREHKTIAPNGHTHAAAVKENVKASTCITEGGYDEVVYCKTCSVEISRVHRTVAGSVHTLAAAVKENEVEATCSKEGGYDSVVYCSVCTAEISRIHKTIAKLSHVEDKGTVVKEATCTENGTMLYCCAVCNAEMRTSVIKSNGHIHDGGKITTPPTCTDPGIKTYTCTACGDTETETIPATGHKEIPIGTASEPTCIAEGRTAGVKCSVCGTVLEEQSILPRVDHHYVDAICTVCEKEKEYTVTFVANGKTISVQTYTRSNKNIVEPDVPEVDGYESNGWKKYTLSGNITVYAVYTAKVYCVTLNARGGVCDAKTANVTFGKTYKLPVPTNEEYLFVGWFSSASSDAERFTDENGASLSVYAYAGNKQFYAHYSAPKVEIVLDYDNGNPVCKKDVVYGTAFDVGETPAKDGCIFDGWFTDSGEEYTFSTIVRKGVTLKAKWTVSTPVSTADELFAIAENPTANYHLTKDITLPNSHKVWTAIEKFSGILNGNGHTITNISLTLGDNMVYGFVATNEGIIENLNFNRVAFAQKITASSLNEGYRSGIIAGNNNGTIKNCHLLSGTMDYVINQVNKYCYVGTIAGANTGIISDCSSVIGLSVNSSLDNLNKGIYHYVGGIVGKNYGIMSGVRFESSIEYTGVTVDGYHSRYDAETNHWVRLGGLTGEIGGGTINECYATADIIVTNGRASYAHTRACVGGLTGSCIESAVVKNSFAQGTVTVIKMADFAVTEQDVGGFVGYNASKASIYNCYTTADVKVGNGKNIGGFVGRNDGANISGCYSSGDVVATDGGTMGGFVGKCTDAGGSVSNCYSCGNIQTNGGTVGMFVGSSSISITDCYFMKDARLMIDGVIYDISSDFDGTINGKICYDIWSEAFLIDELFWTSEDGWVILTDEDPIFDWEIEVFHDYETYVFEPTCDEYGFTLYLCNDCTRFFVRDIIVPLGHEFDYEHPVEKKATCTESGYKYYVCMREGCTEEHGKIEIEEVYSPLGHTRGEVIYGTAADGKEKTYEPTCEDVGRTTYGCSVCGKEFSVEEPALKHDEYVSKAEIQATCYFDSATGEYVTVAGCTAEIKCHRCKTVLQESEIIEPHHHFKYEYTTEPTCTKPGVGTATCKMCGYVLISSQLPELGHIDVNGDYRCDRCRTYMISSSEEAKEGDYVLIKDAAGLRAIADNLKGTYILDADIKIDGFWSPIGTEKYPFTGRLFGDGHKISGLNCGGEGAQGLFGYNNGFISGITLDGLQFSVRSKGCVFGGFAAYNRGVIRDCVITGKVSILVETEVETEDVRSNEKSILNIIGGVVGQNERGGIISACSSTACYENRFSNTARTTFKPDYSWYRDLINKMFNLDKIRYKRYKTVSNNYIYFGQICGYNYATIDDCSATGTGKNDIRVRAETLRRAGTAVAYTLFYQSDSLCGANKGEYTGNNVRGAAFDYTLKQNYDNTVDGFYYKMQCMIDYYAAS